MCVGLKEKTFIKGSSDEIFSLDLQTPRSLSGVHICFSVSVLSVSFSLSLSLFSVHPPIR